jgi:PAS domain S-box-containing protein
MAKKQTYEKALEQIEERYRAIVENRTEMICCFLPDGTLTFLNEAYCRYFRKNRVELIGHKFLPLIPDADREKAFQNISSLNPTNPTVTHEHRVLASNGEVFWHKWTNRAIFDEQYNLMEYQAVGWDITERKQAEETLWKSEERLNAFIDSATDGFVLFDSELNYLKMNKAAQEITGVDRKEVTGKNVLDVIPDFKETGRYDKYKKVMKTGVPLVIPDLIPHPKFGKRRINLKAFKVGDGLGVIFTDITGRKQFEEALQKAHDLNERVKELNCLYSISGLVENPDTSLDEIFQGVVNIIPSSWKYPEVTCSRILLNGKEYKTENFKQTNWKQASDIFVYGELKGTLEVCHLEEKLEIDESPFLKEERSLISAIAERLGHIIERKQTEEALRESEEKYRLLVNNIPSIVYKGYKDWSVDFFDEKIESLIGYDVDEFNSRRMKWIDIIVEEDLKAAREIFIQALKTDKSYIREYRIISKTGGINWIQERGQIVCDNKGEIEYVNGVFFDITDRKQMQEELLKAKKLESIGILAGGIAHDFNNLLTIIIGNIELAKDDIKPEVGISECLEEAEKASIQTQALTRQLITFSKGGAPVKEIGLIGDMVTETTNLAISKSNVKCDFLISHDLWPVEFDEGQMKHAVKNMIDNAVESMPDEGTIHVRAENINITAEQGLPFSEGKYVKISIRDHGVGIPEEHLSQIFDPYFSTKEMGIQKGMGLGLAITYSIINSHDGYITVESEVGVGTTFTLFLPAHEKDIRELEPVKILEP